MFQIFFWAASFSIVLAVPCVVAFSAVFDLSDCEVFCILQKSCDFHVLHIFEGRRWKESSVLEFYQGNSSLLRSTRRNLDSCIFLGIKTVVVDLYPFLNSIDWLTSAENVHRQDQSFLTVIASSKFLTLWSKFDLVKWLTWPWLAEHCVWWLIHNKPFSPRTRTLGRQVITLHIILKEQLTLSFQCFIFSEPVKWGLNFLL